MASKREKFGLILLGIFLGLVVSASFLWWQKHLTNIDWLSFKGIRSVYDKLFDRKSDVLTQNSHLPGKTPSSLPLGKSPIAQDSLDAAYDSLLMNDSATFSYMMENGAFEYYIESDYPYDSSSYTGRQKRNELFRRDSIPNDTLKNSKDFVIKREQFLLTKVYPVSGFIDTIHDDGENLDSLLTSDVRTRRLPPRVVQVEFWKSPVNYTGYKLSSNRLILFGAFNPDEISFGFQNRKLFLHYKSASYLLVNTIDFKPLLNVKRP